MAPLPEQAALFASPQSDDGGTVVVVTSRRVAWRRWGVVVATRRVGLACARCAGELCCG